MNVLVACEFSGTVRDAFSRRGHDAWSCDILPTESLLTQQEGKHIMGDAIDAIYSRDWDLLIAHPPCTFITNSGVRWLYPSSEDPKEVKRAEARWQSLEYARNFFMAIHEAPVERIAIENPIPHCHADLPDYTQCIQPWMFGVYESKATCLWLKNLEPLQPLYETKEQCRESLGIPAGEKPKGRIHLMSPGPNRGKERSVFYPCFAEAMAEQWSQPLSSNSIQSKTAMR